MGTLRQVGTGRTVVLRPRHLVGRSSRCELVLVDPTASAEHAVLSWEEEDWRVRDLASRNGTWLDGRRVAEPVPVPLDATLAFGTGRERWVLVNDAPPAARATADGVVVEAVGGVLSLPDAEAPEVCVFRCAAGTWLAESTAGVDPVASGARVRAGGRSWALDLPHALPATRTGPTASVATVELRFRVSLDEEHVEAVLALPGGATVDLGSRAHHYTLLTLARHRLADRDRGDQLPESAHGWRYQEEVLRELGIDANVLHLHLHRARRQLGEAGLPDAGDIVERRPGAGQLRLGCGHVRVVRV